jgi:NADPH2:quinone reductase
MKAVYITEFGPSDNLEIREVSNPPKPNDTEVLVRVKAAGLNRADLLQRKGLYPAPAGYSSNIPGLEFAGEIVEIGDEVNSLKIGDRVFGITAGEAQAEYLIADETVLAKIPESLTYEEAAAVPEAFITAHDAVFTQAGLKSCETVLVHAVGSGVGLAALQMAKAAGAKVLGTSRTADKLTRCNEMGMDAGIVVGKEADFSLAAIEMTGGRGVNVVLDLVGASYFKENLASLASRGRMILVGLTGGASAEVDLRMALQKRLKIMGTVLRARSTEEKAEATKAFADFALRLFESGAIKPNLDKVFEIEDVEAAYNYLESNESFGKVVLKI